MSSRHRAVFLSLCGVLDRPPPPMPSLITSGQRHRAGAGKLKNIPNTKLGWTTRGCPFLGLHFQGDWENTKCTGPDLLQLEKCGP